MNTIILTGFGKFGDYLANSSLQVAQELDGKIIGKYKIQTHTFRCMIPDENRGTALLDNANLTHASGIICLGMASEKKGLTVERFGANKIDCPKYAPMNLNGKSIESLKPYGYRVQVELAPWRVDKFQREAVRRKMPAITLSDNAGGFCCNHLIWQVVRAKRKPYYPTPFIFIHLPCSPEAVNDRQAFEQEGKVTMAVAEMIKGIELLLEVAVLPPPPMD